MSFWQKLCSRWCGCNQTNKAILNRLAEMETNIMSAISDYLAKQAAFNARQEAAIESVTGSLSGLTEDVIELNRVIVELQNSSGGVTPGDQALITEAETKGAALTARLETFATALEALNAQTPPTVPPV